MQAGLDFPSYFEQDNYPVRHTTGNNMYDPESLITGAEIADGMTYDNSHRDHFGPEAYKLACSGEWNTDNLAYIAPRVEND